MDNANVNQPEAPQEEPNTGETKTVELTPELEAKLNEIKMREETKPAPKGKKGLIAAIIILLAVIAVACIAIALNNQKKGNEPSPTTSAGPKVETVEDVAVKEKLYQKIAVLNVTDYKNATNSKFLETGVMRSPSFMLTYIPNFYENSGYTAKQQLYTLLLTLRNYENRFEDLTGKNIDPTPYIKDNPRVETKDQFYKNVKGLSAEYVAERYKELYGVSVQHADTIEMCGGFNYDEKSGLYLTGLNDACGGMDFRSLMLRVLDVTKTDDSYSVTANAVTMYTGDGNNQKTCNVYDAVYSLDNNGKVYKTCTMDDQFNTDFVLTADDADNVAKYRFDFDENYHFTGITKL